MNFQIHRETGLGARPATGHVRIAGVQMDPVIGDPERNFEICLSAMTNAREQGANLVVFPECSLTGYCFSDREEATRAALGKEGPIMRRVSEAAAEMGVVCVVGYLERTPSGLANAVSMLGPDGVGGHYRKTHLPHLGGDRFVEQGSQPPPVVEALGLRVGLQICYDASFPEATRLLALAGADLVVLPTNWPQEAEAKAGWLPNARAYENVIYFASVNRVGSEKGFDFHGMSRICNPEGKTLVEAPRDAEVIVIADLDPVRARTKRIERREGYWLDRIEQRREDLYRLTAGQGQEDS
jgi:predicted amidohydrolase